MKKKVILLSIVSVVLISILTVVICTRKTPNIEVYEISDYVHYKLINNQDVKNYTGDKNVTLEVFLQYENTDYEASSSQYSMDYYVKKGFSKISASDLKVGDKLYFKFTKVYETLPAIAYGSYLYMC